MLFVFNSDIARNDEMWVVHHVGSGDACGNNRTPDRKAAGFEKIIRYGAADKDSVVDVQELLYKRLFRFELRTTDDDQGWRGGIERIGKIVEFIGKQKACITGDISRNADNRCMFAMRYRKGVVDIEIGEIREFLRKRGIIRGLPRVLTYVLEEYHIAGFHSVRRHMR